MVPKLESMLLGEQNIINPYDNIESNMSFFKKKVDRRKFLKGTGTVVGGLVGTGFLSSANAQSSDIWDYPRVDHPKLKNTHPLYSLLYNNAIVHSQTSKDGENLQLAIIGLLQEDFDASAYILIPSYQITDRRKTVNVEKLDSPGGDNPTYWATLRLTCELIKRTRLYEGSIDERNRNVADAIPLPNNQSVLAFANSIISQGRNDRIYTGNRNLSIQNHTTYGNKLLASNFFQH